MLISELDSDLFAVRITQLIDIAGGNSELARKCEVSESVVRKWRNGESDPSRKRLMVIADIMGVSLEWLASGKGSMWKGETVAVSSSPDIDDFCYIPLYDVYASTGHGLLNDNEQIIDRLAFKQSWFRTEIGLSPENCCLIHVIGDSMEPTLHKRDVVMIDCSPTNIIEDGIYCLKLSSGLLIKRIQRLMGRKLKVISDNPAYEAFTIDDFNTEDHAIIGRVVWAGKRF
ncbi:LexA family transcriptional regulator [Methylobacter sp.]|uniref:LexA family transcriptional regulator n=1 Tax=Methylobacter sp. TaxID=2051955 RepID=UPI002FDDE02E